MTTVLLGQSAGRPSSVTPPVTPSAGRDDARQLGSGHLRRLARCPAQPVDSRRLAWHTGRRMALTVANDHATTIRSHPKDEYR